MFLKTNGLLRKYSRGRRLPLLHIYNNVWRASSTFHFFLCLKARFCFQLFYPSGRGEKIGRTYFEIGQTYSKIQGTYFFATQNRTSDTLLQGGVCARRHGFCWCSISGFSMPAKQNAESDIYPILHFRYCPIGLTPFRGMRLRLPLCAFRYRRVVPC